MDILVVLLRSLDTEHPYPATLGGVWAMDADRYQLWGAPTHPGVASEYGTYHRLNDRCALCDRG